MNSNTIRAELKERFGHKLSVRMAHRASSSDVYITIPPLVSQANTTQWHYDVEEFAKKNYQSETVHVIVRLGY